AGVGILRKNVRNTRRCQATRARDARRNGRARTAGAAGVAVDLIDREAARALIDGVGLLVSDAQHRITAAVVEIGADRRVDAEDVAVALFGQLFRSGDFKTREVALGDEV